MKPTSSTPPDLDRENHALRQAAKQAQAQLRSASQRLDEVLQDELIMAETPMEAWTAMDSAVGTIHTVLRALGATPKERPARVPGAPTRQQGQFLAFIQQYMLRNHGGVAPTHSAMQRFFNLSAPSVNSMLVRLERLGFIRRIPRQARGIELSIAPSLIPRLERPFKM